MGRIRTAFRPMRRVILVAALCISAGGCWDAVAPELQANLPPTVDAGPDLVVEEQSDVVLRGNASDPDGTVVRFTWTQGGGTPVAMTSSESSSTEFLTPVATQVLTLDFTLTVEDDDGAVARDGVTVTVEPVNAAPVVSAGEDRLVTEGSQVNLVGSATDPDGGIASVSWVQTGGPPVELDGADALEVGFVGPATVLPVTLSFRLSAVDDEGAAASDEVNVEVHSRVDAGFHRSIYSPAGAEASPEHWVDVARRIAGGSWRGEPSGLWTVAHLFGRRPLLSFPGSSEDPFIDFSPEDENEAAFTAFDEAGVGVWLVIEPGDASVEELIGLVLDRYGDHPSVRGVAVDLEWYRASSYRDGKPATDGEARAWLDVLRSFAPDYELVLIHWEEAWMPPTLREGLIFLDDSQDFGSVNAMLEEFEDWGSAFTPSPVGFLYGFASDQWWWSAFEDPAVEIGGLILDRVPNAAGKFWIDSTALD